MRDGSGWRNFTGKEPAVTVPGDVPTSKAQCPFTRSSMLCVCLTVRAVFLRVTDPGLIKVTTQNGSDGRAL